MLPRMRGSENKNTCGMIGPSVIFFMLFYHLVDNTTNNREQTVIKPFSSPFKNIFFINVVYNNIVSLYNTH